MTTAKDIIALLRERYALSDGWISMAEVTPPETSRRMDFLAVTAWQSRGFEACGFEVKVSRSDWLSELKSPAKAEPLVCLCSRWWIVAPAGVVRAAEMPETWGLITVNNGALKAMRQAPKLTPVEWDLAIWRCMLLRLATREARTPDEIAEAAHQARTQAFKEAAAEEERAVKYHRDLQERDSKRLHEVAEKLGGSFKALDDPAVVALIQAVTKGNAYSRRHIADAIESSAGDLTTAAERMMAACAKLRTHPVEGVEA